MKATLRFRERVVLAGGALVEMVIWELPAASTDRPHRIKYRLYCGKEGKCVVRYDNEIGKGDHVHYGESESKYEFKNWEQLIADFLADVARLTGEGL